MKKCLFLLCALLALGLFSACTEDAPAPETGTETAGETIAATTSATTPETLPETTPTTVPETLPETETESPYAPIDPATLTAAKTYDNQHGAVLSTYPGKTVEDYEGVCVYYEQAGYERYCENAIGGNLYSTYVKGAEMAHVYRIEAEQELNIVRSETNGATLPPRDGGAIGEGVTSITQLQQQASETSGMAYVIHLSDGSFLVYDGGYASTIGQLLTELKALNGGNGDIHIRAWIMSHSHDDHYSGFRELSMRGGRYLNEYDVSLTLDYFVLAPISDTDAVAMDDDGNFYASQLAKCMDKLEGTQVCYVHTGMTLRFAGMALDVLYTGEDLFIDGSTGYFNDSSMVTRLRSEREGESHTMLFLGDAGSGVADRLERYYGDALKSDMCQISHHGVEDFPLSAYEKIAASTLFYPCNNWLYALTDRDADVRAALRESDVTEEILLRENDKYTRYFDPSKNPAPIGKPDKTGLFPETP